MDRVDVNSDNISIIDFSAYSSEKDSPDKKKLQQLVDEIHHALTTIGFFYLKNTGFPAHVIKDAFEKSEIFFTSEMDMKLKHHMWEILPRTRSNFGYVSADQERLDTKKRHLELKECYNYLPHDVQEIEPSILKEPVECSDLINALQAFFEHGKSLNNRVLEVIARGLNLADPYFFVKKHKYCGQKGSIINVRSTYYPPLNVGEVLGDQIRCGEHSDWGGITLLVKDAPGLEVRNLKGQWTPAPPIEGTILVFAGDLMQRWTSDRIIAAKHRVVLPASEEEMRRSRLSITFFGHPDCDEIIECIDGSEKYQPIGSREYFDFKLNEITAKEDFYCTYFAGLLPLLFVVKLLEWLNLNLD